MTFVDGFGAPCDANWPQAIEARDAAMKALEDIRAKGELDNPLDAAVVLPDADGMLGGFDLVDLADLIGVSRVTLGGGCGRGARPAGRGAVRAELETRRDGARAERWRDAERSGRGGCGGRLVAEAGDVGIVQDECVVGVFHDLACCSDD